jgi:hypothetical protein
MGKVISKSDRPDFYAKGGSGKMFGRGEAGRAESGTSGKQSNAPAGGDEKFASGGKNHMFGKGRAGKATPGQSGKSGQD